MSELDPAAKPHAPFAERGSHDGVDVVLATPPVSEGEMSPHGPGVPPLGLLYLAAVLRDAGRRVVVVDAAWEALGVAEAAIRILAWRPRLVGLTGTTCEYPRVVELVRELKRRQPCIRVVGGGPHVTYRPHEALADGFDVVVLGEGELALVALIEEGEAAAASLPNVVTGRAPGRTVLRSTDVGSIPVPARDLVDLVSYRFPGVMVSARGCPHGCYFCSVSRRAGAFRPRPEDCVVAEALDLRDRYRLGRVEFLDDTFFAVPERALRLGRAIGKLGLEWAAASRVDEILALGRGLFVLAESGLSTLFLGIESGDDGVLRRAKALTLSETKHAVQIALDVGIPHIRASFIVGHPWDTAATIANTERFMLDLLDRGVDVSVT